VPGAGKADGLVGFGFCESRARLRPSESGRGRKGALRKSHVTLRLVRSDTRQFATEAIAQNDDTVPDGLVGRERRYAKRCEDKGIFG